MSCCEKCCASCCSCGCHKEPTYKVGEIVTSHGYYYMIVATGFSEGRVDINVVNLNTGRLNMYACVVQSADEVSRKVVETLTGNTDFRIASLQEVWKELGKDHGD